MGWLNKGVASALTSGMNAASQGAQAQHQAAMQQAAALQQQLGAAWGQAAAAVTDPDAVAFMQLPPAEQARQQAALQEYGTNLRWLYENGVDAEITIRSMQATGVTLAGQHEYTVEVDVMLPGREPYQLALRQVIAAAAFPGYAVGGRYKAKVSPSDAGNAAILERIG
ncbi:hypothetical protein [Pseudactinotalea sp.]|uniref:hypothetical protein n=1 Tax=Pseudactinotalea sp. TaxID=1926260 RepID=UPI003B3BCC16